jgi:hypothetical protein
MHSIVYGWNASKRERRNLLTVRESILQRQAPRLPVHGEKGDALCLSMIINVKNAVHRRKSWCSIHLTSLSAPSAGAGSLRKRSCRSSRQYYREAERVPPSAVAMVPAELPHPVDPWDPVDPLEAAAEGSDSDAPATHGAHGNIRIFSRNSIAIPTLSGRMIDAHFPASLAPMSKAFSQSPGNISSRLFCFFSGSNRGAKYFA